LKIILNADDVGMNKSVNQATARLIEQGMVTSISIMPNESEFQSAVELTKMYPHVSAGVHLNISSGKPLSATGLLPILDENGCFRNNLRTTNPNRSLRAAIFREWCLQVERLINQNIEISHVDSHYHTHTIPGLLQILFALQRRYKIRSIRLTKNLYLSSDKPPMWKILSKSVVNTAIRRISKVTIADKFTEFSTFHDIQSTLDPNIGVIELMLHPGSEVPEYQREIDLLESHWQTLVESQVEITNYSNLCGRA